VGILKVVVLLEKVQSLTSRVGLLELGIGSLASSLLLEILTPIDYLLDSHFAMTESRDAEKVVARSPVMADDLLKNLPPSDQ
jgi:hypothetical protein